MDSVDRAQLKLEDIGVQLSRRDVLRLAAFGGLGLAGASLLAACESDDDGEAGAAPTADDEETEDPSTPDDDESTTETDDPSDEQPDDAGSGGIWNMAIISNPTAYPITAPSALTDILVNKVLYSTLVRYALDGDQIVVEPDLAESFEANEDLTEYTFVLREGVKWHDGEDFDADDVVFTIDTILDPDVNASSRANLSAIESVEKIDQYNVVFRLSFPYAPLPVMLGYNVPMVPQHILEGQDMNEPVDFLAHPIGTGPMKFRSYSAGSFLETERFDDFFRGPARLDGIVFKILPDVNTQVAQLQSGDLDFTVIEPAQVEVLERAANVDVTYAPQVNYMFLGINHEIPLFQDRSVRQAMAYAIDRHGIIDEILQGAATPASGPISPLLAEYHNPDVRSYDYDPDMARDLLEEAGWVPGADGILEKDGERFSFLLEADRGNPTREQIIAFAQQLWQDIGMEVEIEFFERNVHLERARSTNYDVLMNWWITPPDPDIFAHYHSTSGVNNRWNYNNPEVDSLIEEGRSEPDIARRQEIYFELQEVLAEDVPIVYLYYPQEIQAISTRTQNFPFIGYRDALTHMEEVWIDD